MGQCAVKSAGGGWPVVPGTIRVDAGDDTAPPRAARGSGSACARRDGGGKHPRGGGTGWRQLGGPVAGMVVG